jgi:hypothetical protein
VKSLAMKQLKIPLRRYSHQFVVFVLLTPFYKVGASPAVFNVKKKHPFTTIKIEDPNPEIMHLPGGKAACVH